MKNNREIRYSFPQLTKALEHKNYTAAFYFLIWKVKLPIIFLLASLAVEFFSDSPLSAMILAGTGLMFCSFRFIWITKDASRGITELKFATGMRKREYFFGIAGFEILAAIISILIVYFVSWATSVDKLQMTQAGLVSLMGGVFVNGMALVLTFSMRNFRNFNIMISLLIVIISIIAFYEVNSRDLASNAKVFGLVLSCEGVCLLFAGFLAFIIGWTKPLIRWSERTVAPIGTTQNEQVFYDMSSLKSAFGFGNYEVEQGDFNIPADEVTEKIKPESVYIFLGRNGSGKTLEIKKVFENIILTNRFKNAFSITDELDDSFNQFTVSEFLNFVAAVPFMDANENTAQIETVFEYYKRFQFDDHDLDSLMGDLSSGERKVIILMAYLTMPFDILFIDEPEAYLSEQFRDIVEELMDRFVAAKHTLIISSHSEDLVQFFNKYKPTYVIFGKASVKFFDAKDWKAKGWDAVFAEGGVKIDTKFNFN